MYNRYIPSGATYTRIPEEEERSSHAGPGQARSDSHPGGDQPSRGAGHRAQDHRPSSSGEGKGPSWLSGLLRNLHLDDLDTGDILLLLILLFLFMDGDDMELLITLGLLILLGLGGKSEKESS